MGNLKHLMYRMELSSDHSLALVDGVYAPQTKDVTFIIDDYMQEWKNICNKHGKKMMDWTKIWNMNCSVS